MAPLLEFYLASVITLRTFLRFRKEVSENLTKSHPSLEMTQGYKRLALITSINTVFNLLGAEIIITIMAATTGQSTGANKPYISWDNVHDGAAGEIPGATLGTILQEPASEWSAFPTQVFVIKWNVWLYVAHALVFFTVFGTTPAMKEWYAQVFYYIPRKLGCARSPLKDTHERSTINFAPNPKTPKRRTAPRYYFQPRSKA